MSPARNLVHLARSLARCYLTFGKSQMIQAKQQSARSINIEIFMYLQTNYVRIDATKCMLLKCGEIFRSLEGSNYSF